MKNTGIGINRISCRCSSAASIGRHNAAAYPGSGLGLAYVKAVAERHGGRVAAANAARGTRFTVTLPRAQV